MIRHTYTCHPYTRSSSKTPNSTLYTFGRLLILSPSLSHSRARSVAPPKRLVLLTHILKVYDIRVSLAFIDLSFMPYTNTRNYNVFTLIYLLWLARQNEETITETERKANKQKNIFQ